MIAHIRGTIIGKDERGVIIETGGIGYRLFTTAASAAAATEGAEVRFWTYMAVREDAMDLFGFADKAEQRLFEQLLSVSGIGPKSAMNILSGSGAEAIRRAVTSQDAGYLTKVSGVGKKTAEKIVLELHDKIVAGVDDSKDASAESEALDALESLGYSMRDMREIVRAIARHETDPGEIVRKSLRELGK